MIKVIKKPYALRLQIACTPCEIRLEYEQDDVVKDNEGRYFVVCPICQVLRSTNNADQFASSSAATAR